MCIFLSKLFDFVNFRSIYNNNNNNMIICWFSCGATSAVACHLALKEYGDKAQIYYCETGGEHEDNKRFLLDCEKWYGKKIHILRNPKFKDHFDVLEKRGYSHFGASCTLELKKKMRYKLEDEHPDFEGQIFGFDISETKRAQRFKEQYPNSKPIFPLIEKSLSKSECLGILQKAGIEIPKMYKLGYNNNNCIGCVKGGIGYFNKIRKDFPEHFKRMSEVEEKRNFACLKDHNGKQLFLKDLDPNRGKDVVEIMPECGLFCELEFFG
mgnify:FL=1